MNGAETDTRRLRGDLLRVGTREQVSNRDAVALAFSMVDGVVEENILGEGKALDEGHGGGFEVGDDGLGAGPFEG